MTVNGQSSSEMVETSGVPQGSVLGPLLFDIPNCMRGADCRLYVDDTLLGMDTTVSGISALQDNVIALTGLNMGYDIQPQKMPIW